MHAQLNLSWVTDLASPKLSPFCLMMDALVVLAVCLESCCKMNYVI